MAQANITDLFGILPEMAVGGATPQQIMNIIVTGSSAGEPESSDMGYDPSMTTAFNPIMNPQEATAVAIEDYLAEQLVDPNTIQRAENKIESENAQMIVSDIYNVLENVSNELDPSIDIPAVAKKMAVDISKGTLSSDSPVSEQAIINVINQVEENKASDEKNYKVSPGMLNASIEYNSENVYDFTPTVDLDQFPGQLDEAELMAAHGIDPVGPVGIDPVGEAELMAAHGIDPLGQENAIINAINGEGNILTGQRAYDTSAEEQEEYNNIVYGELEKIRNAYMNAKESGYANPVISSSNPAKSALERIQAIISSNEGQSSSWGDVLAIDIINAWDKNTTHLPSDIEDVTTKDATKYDSTRKANNAAVEKIIKEFQDWEYSNTSIEQIFTNLQIQLNQLGDQYKNSDYFEIPLSDIMKGWNPDIIKTVDEYAKTNEQENQNVDSSITYESLISSQNAIPGGANAIDSRGTDSFFHIGQVQSDTLGTIQLHYDRNKQEAFAFLPGQDNWFSLGSSKLIDENGVFIQIGGENSPIYWHMLGSGGLDDISASSGWSQVSTTGKSAVASGMTSLAGLVPDSKIYETFKDKPSALWETARVQQMGNKAHNPQFWDIRMHGYTNKYGNYLMAPSVGMETFYDFLRTPQSDENRAANWGEAVRASSIVGTDLDINNLYLGTDPARDWKIRDALGNKSQTLAIAAAGFGINPDSHGGRMAYSRLGDIYDIFASRARGSGKPVEGFLAYLNSQMTPSDQLVKANVIQPMSNENTDEPIDEIGEIENIKEVHPGIVP